MSAAQAISNGISIESDSRNADFQPSVLAGWKQIKKRH
jgi:hypothetical protein